MSTVTMNYGDYAFSPVPLMNISKEYQKTDDGTIVGTLFNVSLEGTLTPLPSGTVGYLAVDALQDGLRSAMAEQGNLFKVQCDATTLIEAYPRINSLSLNTSNNQWVMTCPYSINLEWDDEPNASGENSGIMPPYISTTSEEWSLEFSEDNAAFDWDLDNGTKDAMSPVLRLSHSVSATGKKHYSSAGGTAGQLDLPAWEQARNYVMTKMGQDDQFVANTGVLNLDVSEYGYFNHIRSVTIGELAGSYSVQENWIVFPESATGVPGKALEDFSIEVRESQDDGLLTVGINGTVQGLEERSYGTTSGQFAITANKYDNALSFWNVVKTRLYWRANEALNNTTTTTRGLNTQVKTSSIGHSPGKGTISYNYEYDDRPCNIISGSKTESIQINDSHPTDIFAELTVLGRANGPVLQSISTVSAATRDVAIEVVMEAPSGDCTSCSSQFSSMLSLSNAPTGEVETLLCCFQTDLTDAYSQVFKTSDSSSWNPKTGRYSRNVTWTYTNCSGSAPSTTFC